MLSALLNFKNGSAVAFPTGAKVEPINMSGDGQAFLSALNQFNGEISKGILCQTLATDEGLHDSRAASEVHQDVLDLVVNHVRQTLADMIRRDILVPLVRYNWGDSVAKRLTPKVHLSQSQQHNWAKDAAAVASLVTARVPGPVAIQSNGHPPRFAAPQGRTDAHACSHRRRLRPQTLRRPSPPQLRPDHPRYSSHSHPPARRGPTKWPPRRPPSRPPPRPVPARRAHQPQLAAIRVGVLVAAAPAPSGHRP